MAKYSQVEKLIQEANKILIIQADNPDADSLGSALALEHIWGDLGKDVTLYCGVNIPTYLHYLKGWDRVTNELPKSFDLSVIVDTSAISLIESLQKNNQINQLKSKPCIVLDHHTNDSTIDFATVVVNENVVACGELIYNLSLEMKWELSSESMEYIAGAILSDSLGLTSESTSANSIRVIADIVESGVSLAKLDANRKEYQKKTKNIATYKGMLLQRIHYSASGKIAYVDITWEEIEKYSHDYNPAMLIIDEMRMIEGIEIAIVFKYYKDNKVTAKIRANYGHNVADKLAESFGGGGHPYASGFKVINVENFELLKAKVINKADELLAKN